MKRPYDKPTAEAFAVCTNILMFVSVGLNGETPGNGLNWDGTENGSNPMYIRTWHNKLWDSDDDELN